VAPPTRSRDERPVERGIVSPAVADAVARARRLSESEATAAPRRTLAAVPDRHPRAADEAPRERRSLFASGAAVAGLALGGLVAAKVARNETETAADVAEVRSADPAPAAEEAVSVPDERAADPAVEAEPADPADPAAQTTEEPVAGVDAAAVVETDDDVAGAPDVEASTRGAEETAGPSEAGPAPWGTAAETGAGPAAESAVAEAAAAGSSAAGSVVAESAADGSSAAGFVAAESAAGGSSAAGSVAAESAAGGSSAAESVAGVAVAAAGTAAGAASADQVRAETVDPEPVERKAAEQPASETSEASGTSEASETSETSKASETSETSADTGASESDPGAAPAELVASEDGEPAAVAPVAALPSPRDGATDAPRSALAVVQAGERRLHAVPTGPVPVIDTPAADVPTRPVTLSAVIPTSPAPRSTSEATEDPRAAEHAAVDLALLRTLGFADPNPRKGVAPVVDMSVEHPDEAPEPPGAAVPLAFRVQRRDHAPVAEATVALMDPRGRATATTTADADGRGTVTAPRPGGYVLVASAEGHQPGVVAVRAEEGRDPVEVQLVRSSAVAGTVRDAAGEPVADATLELLQDGELVASTTTTAAGGYGFAELAAGEYTVALLAAGHEPRVVVVRLAEEAAGEQDLVLPGGVDDGPRLG
jgi:hypothetical protein